MSGIIVRKHKLELSGSTLSWRILLPSCAPPNASSSSQKFSCALLRSCASLACRIGSSDFRQDDLDHVSFQTLDPAALQLPRLIWFVLASDLPIHSVCPFVTYRSVFVIGGKTHVDFNRCG